MHGTMYILKVDGTQTERHFDAGYGEPGGPTLDMMQAAVGGSLEIVPHFERYAGSYAVAFCNEEGKIDDLPVNVRATNAWQSAVQAYRPGAMLDDYLAGDVIVFTGDEDFVGSL